MHASYSSLNFLFIYFIATMSQGGSPSELYKNVHRKVLDLLPKSCLLYPAHDYKGNSCSSIREELEWNPRLTKSLPAFVDIMNNLNLPAPKQIATAVPANKNGGIEPPVAAAVPSGVEAEK
jgi:sulfur dioxygenase